MGREKNRKKMGRVEIWEEKREERLRERGVQIGGEFGANMRGALNTLTAPRPFASGLPAFRPPYDSAERVSMGSRGLVST